MATEERVLARVFMAETLVSDSTQHAVRGQRTCKPRFTKKDAGLNSLRLSLKLIL